MDDVTTPADELRPQPIQLRIGFGTPTRHMAMHLTLAGLSVLVESPDASNSDVAAYLTSVDVDTEVVEGRGVTFGVRQLAKLARLPDQVRVGCDALLAPLWELASHPSVNGLPATLAPAPGAGLMLSWFDGAVNHEADFDTAASGALLASGLPFVATADAWDALTAACHLPIIAGRARLNLDGFVEIHTTTPQLVETAANAETVSPDGRATAMLPGLFRLDATHFGLALPYAWAIDAADGFVWEGRRPSPERGPAARNLTLELSSHALADLQGLVDQLAAYRAQMIVWSSGLGRRTFALAALDVLDAWTTLIVTPPSGMWIWQRHLDLLGRSWSLTHDDADALIVTYADLSSSRPLPSPAAIVFDELTSATPEQLAELHRVDGVLDAYRIGIASAWPSDLSTATSLMSVLRPGEFRPDTPVAARYPLSPDARAAEHVEAYLSRRTVEDPTSTVPAFRRSSVRVVGVTDALERALSDLHRRIGCDRADVLLSEMLEMISRGPAHAVSPKVSAAASMARPAAQAGRRVAVLTRFRKTADLLRQLVRPVPVAVIDSSGHTCVGTGEENLRVYCFDRDLPDLRGADDVIVIDYPWSFAALERCVGGAGDAAGPSRVTVVHAQGTVDDRLATFAARRRELDALTDAAAPPSPDDVIYLLAATTC